MEPMLVLSSLLRGRRNICQRVVLFLYDFAFFDNIVRDVLFLSTPFLINIDYVCSRLGTSRFSEVGSGSSFLRSRLYTLIASDLFGPSLAKIVPSY